MSNIDFTFSEIYYKFKYLIIIIICITQNYNYINVRNSF